MNPEFSSESLDRIKKIEQLRALGINPYAQKYDRTHHIAEISVAPHTEWLRTIEEIIPAPKTTYSLAGRITLSRSFWKILFATVLDGSSRLQVLFSRENCSVRVRDELMTTVGEGESTKSAYKILEKLTDVGDFVGVRGELFYTHKGELTLFASEFTILTKSIRPLPEKWHGIADEEIAYRERYLDLITNDSTYERFLFRSRFMKSLRDFYESEGFLEVETPILGNAASGAAAQPFITHHNDYDLDVFLRISPETALKKLTVGRFEKIFEIAKDFRNEGSDPSHLQEFTMVEHYAVYWSYEDNMAFAEKMIQSLFTRLGLPAVIQIEDKEWVVREVDFMQSWERIDYAERIHADTGINILEYSQGREAEMRSAIAATGVKIEGIEKMSLAVMIDYLYKKKTRPQIIGPAIIYNYPKFMQPLARQNDKNPDIVEQFQVIVNGWEIIKAYSELVDPIDQRARFEEQSLSIAAGDEEATSADYDFVQAMEYGMPCQSGLGFGIDRFLTLITGQKNLRDVILFPLMKPKLGGGEAISSPQ
jgi:lysyl-tRNA synthetase class 2